MSIVVKEDTNFFVTIFILLICGAGFFALATHNEAARKRSEAEEAAEDAEDPEAPVVSVTESQHSECDDVIVAEHADYDMTIAYITATSQVEPTLCLLHEGWRPVGTIKAGSPPFPTLGFFKAQTGETWLH